MPDLSFQIVGVEAAASGVTPLLLFKLQITNMPGNGNYSGRHSKCAD